jgi:hypothetical protein
MDMQTRLAHIGITAVANAYEYTVYRQYEVNFLLCLGVLYEVHNRKHLVATPINIALSKFQVHGSVHQ